MNFCPSCGSPASANFCPACGFKLDSASVTEQARSIGEGMANQAEVAAEKQAQALGFNHDFDEQFSSCMQAKGYQVPPGILPKVYAAMPWLESNRTDAVRDWDIEEITKKVAETVAGVALPEMEAIAAIVGELGTGKDIYDQRVLGHAVIDCALRAQAGGPGPVITQLLDAYPVPDAEPPLPPPDARPAVPVLPPPPPNWQPMVIPMEDPAAPAPKSAGMPAGAKVAIGIMMGAAIVGGLALGNSIVQQNGGGGGGGGGGTWYLHYSCGSSQQCADVMGGSDGVRSSYSSYSDCKSAQDAMAANQVMQAQTDGGGAGTWCSQSP